METSCHCGRVKLEAPDELGTVMDCNCSICRRYGLLWAYYSPTQVSIEAGGGSTHVYMWNDRMIEFHRCRNCGCITHWAPADRSADRMGLNARLMPPEVLARAQVRQFDRTSM